MTPFQAFIHGIVAGAVSTIAAVVYLLRAYRVADVTNLVFRKVRARRAGGEFGPIYTEVNVELVRRIPFLGMSETRGRLDLTKKDDVDLIAFLGRFATENEANDAESSS